MSENKISPKLIKELRERTQAGFMDCKKALEATNSDIEAAIVELRKSGAIKAAKKSARIAAEGLVVVKISSDQKSAVILEVNSETDFVARDEKFTTFVEKVAQIALDEKVGSLEELANCKYDGGTVDEKRKELITVLGENINIRRICLMTTQGTIGHYSHGGKMSALVAIEGGNAALAKDLAMHITAAKPQFVDVVDIPANIMEAERVIYQDQAAQSGKPQEIMQKMVDSKLKKFAEEITLLGQSFIKEPSQGISKLLAAQKASVAEFVRFQVGEGIEKEKDDFVKEVMDQVAGNS